MSLSLMFPEGVVGSKTIDGLRDLFGQCEQMTVREWKFPVADCVVSINVQSPNPVDISRMAQYAIDMLSVVVKHGTTPGTAQGPLSPMMPRAIAQR